MSETVQPAPPESGRKRLSIGSRQLRFLAQSAHLDEALTPALMRLALVAIAATTCGFIVWAAVAKVSEIAVATGQVIPTDRVQQIQHLEGGIVAAIHVRDGDLVEAGSTLIRLDGSGAAAELKQMRARRMGLALQAERLRAFADGREPDFSNAGNDHADLVLDQRAIYALQVATHESQRRVFVEQIAQNEAQLALLDEREVALIRQRDILAEELALRRTLYEKQLHSKVLFLDSQREVAEIEGEIATLARERVLTERALAETWSRLGELENTLKRDALAEMGGVSRELAEVEEAMLKLEDRVDRLEIRAPIRGIVKGLNVHTVGGVIGSGDTAVEVVPVNDDLVVEARLSPRDVGHVAVGQPATVKVLSYDYARFGGIDGELESISASSFIDENGEAFYVALVRLDQTYVGQDPNRNRVLPGMTVQADIETGGKTILEYLLKPVYASVNSAFRER